MIVCTLNWRIVIVKNHAQHVESIKYTFFFAPIWSWNTSVNENFFIIIIFFLSVLMFVAMIPVHPTNSNLLQHEFHLILQFSFTLFTLVFFWSCKMKKKVKVNFRNCQCFFFFFLKNFSHFHPSYSLFSIEGQYCNAPSCLIAISNKLIALANTKCC